MKKMKTAALAVLITVGMLTGCGGRGGLSGTFDPEQSSIFATDDGMFSTATVETYESQEYYNQDEWKAFLETAVTEYNGVNGEGAVILKSCSMDEGTAKMIFDYASGKDLAQFSAQYEDTANQVKAASVITVAELMSQAGETGFVKVSKGKTVTLDEIAKSGDYHVAVIEGENPVTIQTEGKIVYVSEGTVVKDNFTALTTKGKNYIIYR